MKLSQTLLFILLFLLSCVINFSQTRQFTRVKLPEELVKQLVKDKPELGNGYENNFNELWDSFPFASKVNLNADRLPDFIVYAGAFRSGNSSGPIWIYSRTRNGYTQLLDYSIYLDQDPNLLQTKTNGYQDIEFKGGSNPSMVFKFDGKRYQLATSNAQKTAQNNLDSKSESGIRRIDFKNYTYEYSESKIKVRNGKWKGKYPGEYFNVDKIVYGDVTGDGQEEAIVITSSSGGGSGNFSGATVYSLKNNRLITLYVYPGDGYGPYDGLPGGDRGNGSINDVKIQNGELWLEKFAPSDLPNTPQYVAAYIDTYIFRWNGSYLISDGNRKQRRAVSEKQIQPAIVTGYIDVVEKSGSGCRIRIISGDKIYSGIITFSRISTLTKQKINNYEDAVRVLSGKQVKVTLSDISSLSGGISGISFGNITQMTFPVSRETKQSAQTWSERSTDKETIIDLSTDILFDFDKSTIKPNAVPTLIRLARLIRQANSGVIQLNGFTDSKGTDEYNLDLSERRADSVKQWLVSKGGVNAGRIQTKGLGESQPVVPNTNPNGSDNPTGRQKNRRVEVRIPRV
jgi:outer membrane protein OmpA-like peptidoglycan-associated protein